MQNMFACANVSHTKQSRDTLSRQPIPFSSTIILFLDAVHAFLHWPCFMFFSAFNISRSSLITSHMSKYAGNRDKVSIDEISETQAEILHAPQNYHTVQFHVNVWHMDSTMPSPKTGQSINQRYFEIDEHCSSVDCHFAWLTETHR